jgi:hypothetical protein
VKIKREEVNYYKNRYPKLNGGVNTMKILVLNGSPRSNGNTAKMIDAFRLSDE